IFLFVKLINTARKKLERKQEIIEEIEKGPTTEELLTQIRDLLKEKEQEMPLTEETSIDES
ncbi:MAG: hypothetical protein ACLVG9_04450, partial [Eubacteriales bacterium]